MPPDLNAWQRSAIRDTMANYRRAQEDYFGAAKPVVELAHGYKAFSLLTPPLGSPAARRRVRLIMGNMMQGSAGQASMGPTAALTAANRTPHVMTMAVTYACQCDCQHCSAADYRDRTRIGHSTLTFEELKGVIEQTVDLGTTCLILTGGEPLLHPRVHDLIAAVDQARCVCTVFTNGEFLSDETVATLKDAGVFGVFVSLDDSDPSRHDANRGRPGLADLACRGVKRCQLAGIPTGLSTYVTREKIGSGELDAMMDLARRLEVLEVFLFDVIPAGRLAGRHECLLTDDDARSIIDFRAKYAARTDYPRIVHQTMFASIAYPCVAEGCPAGIVQMHLRANGDVSPCDFTPLTFGNVRDKPLREIWDSIAGSPLYAVPSARCRLSKPDFWDALTHAASI